LGDQRGKSADFGVNQPLMAGAPASSGDRLGKRTDLKRLLQLGRGAEGSRDIVQGVTRREDQRNAAPCEETEVIIAAI
jgi:hypothetical protein